MTPADILNEHSLNVSQCKHYTSENFNRKFEHNGQTDSLAIFNFNIRSLKSNFGELVNFLGTIDKKFHVIGLSETWVRNETATDFFNIEIVILVEEVE